MIGEGKRTMAFKLSVAPLVDVPVKITVQAGAKRRTMNITLVGKRMLTDGLEDLSKRAADKTLDPVAFLHDVIVDWRGDQSIVLDDADGSPAPFSAEALDCLLSLPMVTGLCMTAYMAANGIEGKQGN